MRNPEVVTDVLNAISELGVSFALDDFGTGYSALAYLTRLPVHTIKLDRTFVFNMSTDWEAEMLAFGILALAKSLHFRVVAEGVETPEQLAMLRQWGCDEMQGYLFSPPVPAEEATRLLAEQRESA
jgi:EAL domain-containing protein (putative c-di-GMP-specific phosphodiesterase class I)